MAAFALLAKPALVLVIAAMAGFARCDAWLRLLGRIPARLQLPVMAAHAPNFAMFADQRITGGSMVELSQPPLAAFDRPRG